jgi:hypothetical protein
MKTQQSLFEEPARIHGQFAKRTTSRMVQRSEIKLKIENERLSRQISSVWRTIRAKDETIIKQRKEIDELKSKLNENKHKGA